MPLKPVTVEEPRTAHFHYCQAMARRLYTDVSTPDAARPVKRAPMLRSSIRALRIPGYTGGRAARLGRDPSMLLSIRNRTLSTQDSALAVIRDHRFRSHP